MRPLLVWALVFAQTLGAQQSQTPARPLPAGESAVEGQPKSSQLLEGIESNASSPKGLEPSVPIRRSFLDFASPYRVASLPPFRVISTNRVRSLVRDGAIYLSLYDALAMAIENNLNVEISRYDVAIAGTETPKRLGSSMPSRS